MDYLEMISCLEEYYEAAGFADFFNQVLVGMSEEEVKALFNRTFGNNDEK
ncbi:hypothetical protein SAMN02910358_00739 [Lachnospiraceae bacterium XBB1006]|nr:hypothetical protein SAMN02910358_00739 [Lachnospiraceae bacterium XBB1006]